MRSQMLVEMMNRIKNDKLNIDSATIVRNGYLVLDAYFFPATKKQPHNIYSCSKSIMSALIGIAIDQGYIQSVDQPIIDFFPEKEIDNMDDLKKSITLENLLTMSSGLKCRDSWLHLWAGLGKMRNSSDWTQHVLDLPMEAPPGEKFEYCNGSTYLLSAIIQNTTQMKTLDFANEKLFGPLGIVDIQWETNTQGIDIGYSEMWLKPHDMAKIGWLYLNGGKWKDKQIIPPAWVDVSTTGHIDTVMFNQYGYQWWVDPDGYFAALGHKGQRIFVVPDKGLVVVFTCDMTGQEGLITHELLDRHIIPAALLPDPLPPDKKNLAELNAIMADAAIATAFIWSSQEEGIAADGVFKRSASPAFQFEYPIGSKKVPTQSPGQIMKMTVPGGGEVGFYASVVDIPEGLKLEDFGPKFFTRGYGEMASDIRVVSNNQITLDCGTNAYKTQISWLWNRSLAITTFLVSAYKDGKCVYLATNPWKYHDKVESIVKSLTLR